MWRKRPILSLVAVVTMLLSLLLVKWMIRHDSSGEIPHSTGNGDWHLSWDWHDNWYFSNRVLEHSGPPLNESVPLWPATIDLDAIGIWIQIGQCYGDGATYFFFGLSLTWVMALLLAPQLLWVTLWYRMRRARRKGQCRNCGYDLRGSSGACPECGLA